MTDQPKAPRFANVACSQCGRDFGPGDSGYSHCSDHTPATVADVRRIVREELRDYQLEKDVTSESTATPVSKSDKVAEGLKKIKLADVVSAFQKAIDAEALAAAVALATKMKGSDEDKAAANAAYHEAKKRLSQPKSPDDTAPRPTIAEVRALLSRSENVDDLDAAAGMIDALADPDDMKDALRSDYKTLREEMASEAA